jgi:hypothetical protein
VSGAVLQWLFAGIGVACGAVFLVAFGHAARLTRARERATGLPPARLVEDGVVRSRPRLDRERAQHGIRMFQAGLVAFGVTAVFFMCLCMLGIVILLLVA